MVLGVTTECQGYWAGIMLLAGDSAARCGDRAQCKCGGECGGECHGGGGRKGGAFSAIRSSLSCEIPKLDHVTGYPSVMAVAKWPTIVPTLTLRNSAICSRDMPAFSNISNTCIKGGGGGGG